MQLKAGMTVIYRGRHMEVLDASLGDTVTLIDRGNPDAVYQCAATEVALPRDRPLPLAMADSSQWLEWDRYAQAARKIIAAQTLDERKKQYEESANDIGVSIRTLQRKVKKFRIHNTVSAMQDGKSGRPAGVRLLSPKVEEIIAVQLHERWLQENKPLLTDVIEHIQKECRKLQYPVPSPTTIRQRADRLDEYLRVKCREGEKKAKYRLKPMPGHIAAAKLLETVQIDHTLADITLVSELDPTVVVGRPWVTLAIDVASRMVVGVYISFEPPSAVSVGMCLTNAILPKSDFLAKLGLTGEWPVNGIMERIHTDNGREFHSEALQRGCSELGIDMQQRPVGSPHYGGIIERLIGTFMGKCRLLPGTTQRNVSERGDYDAEGNAVMTLSQFTAFFVNEIVNVYHLTKHRTLEVPPLVKWRDLAAEQNVGRPLPLGYEHWQLPVLFYPFEMRKIRRTGIEFQTRFYWSDELAEWVGREEKCPVHHHPGDASKVYVRGPNGSIIVAWHTGADKRCISFEEVRKARQQNTARSSTTDLINQRDEGLSTRDALIDQAKAGKRKAAHRAAAVKKAREEQTKDVPKDNSSKPPAPTSPATLVFDRNVLDFGTYRKRA